MIGLEARYRSLLRWYPLQWRERNEAAVIGALLDQADETGRMMPSLADYTDIVIGGLRARLIESGWAAASVAVAAGFLVWYLAIVAGTFAHPSLVTLALLIAALITRLAGSDNLSVAIAPSSAASAVVIALIVDGPGPSVTMLLVGLALMGSLKGLRRSQAFALIFAVALATVSAESWRSVATLWPIVVVPQFWVSLAFGIATGAGAFVLSAATLARRVATRGTVAP